MTLRDLTTIDDCRQVVVLEKEIWGYADGDDVVPPPVLIVTVKRGGVLIGAFDERGDMAGFVYSLPAIKGGRTTQWSHMLGVRDAFRNSGLGRDLKWAQRERTQRLGLSLIEWTFDPLQALNAHLNFTRLGVTSDEYEENIYGESSSFLHRGNPTDRLVVQWELASPRVDQCAAGAAVEPDRERVQSFPCVNAAREIRGRLECGPLDLDHDAPQIRIEIPVGFTDLLQTAPALAIDWRMKTRALFTTYFGRGYHAAAFVLDRPAGRGWYVLQHEA